MAEVLRNKAQRKRGLKHSRKALLAMLCEAAAPFIVENDELEAIVTHWTQSPNQGMPYLTTEMRNQCVKVLQTTGYWRPISAAHVLEGEDGYGPAAQLALPFDDIPYPPPASWDFTFIDLFAGIGGFRLAFQSAGGKCVFSCEWDKYAKKTYEANFGEVPYGDIRKIRKNEIPPHDVLCAGFPCQPFSLAGVSKKNSLGRKHGFEDKTQGTLFFEILEILHAKRPKAFMLENVKNLVSHDQGKTFEVIRQALEDELGYIVTWKVVDGAKWVPQHRERIFIVGFDPKQLLISKGDFAVPDKPDRTYKYPELGKIILRNVQGHTLGPGTWSTLERHKAHHALQGNGFGYGLIAFPIKKGELTRTISARYHKDGAEILIAQDDERPRRLTLQEALQLQGFDPERFLFPVSSTQAYKQIGNSVVVPAVHSTALAMAEVLRAANGHVPRAYADIERATAI